MSGFLIDECLSPALVGVAKAHGHAATHIVQLGRAGISDLEVTLLALAGLQIVVTNNRGDFLRPYARLGTDHPGLVVVRPSAARTRQMVLFEEALVAIQAAGDLTGTLIDVVRESDIRIVPWPPR